jgi:hypothetical protein
MLPSQGLMSEIGVVIETQLYQKDERALPGDLHSRKLGSVSSLLNVVFRTTHPLSLFSLSLFGFKRLSDLNNAALFDNNKMLNENRNALSVSVIKSKSII